MLAEINRDPKKSGHYKISDFMLRFGPEGGPKRETKRITEESDFKSFCGMLRNA